jgi:hypothetical protein
MRGRFTSPQGRREGRPCDVARRSSKFWPDLLVRGGGDDLGQREQCLGLLLPAGGGRRLPPALPSGSGAHQVRAPVPYSPSSCSPIPASPTPLSYSPVAPLLPTSDPLAPGWCPRGHGHTREQRMPADSGRGHKLVPVAGGGRGHGHEILLAGAGTQH